MLTSFNFAFYQHLSKLLHPKYLINYGMYLAVAFSPRKQGPATVRGA